MRIAAFETQAHVAGQSAEEKAEEEAHFVARQVEAVETRVVFVAGHQGEGGGYPAGLSDVEVPTERLQEFRTAHHHRLQIAESSVGFGQLEMIDFVTVGHCAGGRQEGFGEVAEPGAPAPDVAPDGPVRIVVGAAFGRHAFRAHLHVRHVAPHEIESVGVDRRSVFFTNVVPHGFPRPVEVDLPVAVVVEALVELVAGQGAEHARHRLRPGDAIVAPDPTFGVNRPGFGTGVDLQSAVGRAHRSRYRLVAIFV